MGDGKPPIGNLLGAARAEIDAHMLSRAFVATADFKALTQTTDFTYVVGRRGTGKSALFQKVAEHYRSLKGPLVIAERPKDYEAAEFQNLLGAVGLDYRLLRGIGRLAWKTHLLFEALVALREHYRFTKLATSSYLSQYAATHKRFLSGRATRRAITLLRHATELSPAPRELAGTFARTFDTEKLLHAVKTALDDTGRTLVVLYDSLDEGWIPDIPSTAVIGGLGLAAADLSDAQTGISLILFLRDNIFRSLSEFDPDFTRHIEGQTLRLHWDEASLFHLVAERLRVALNLPGTENDVKVWNRFARADLKDREGFEQCLRYTLYRPRDILVLLNDAFINAQKAGRESIVGEDVEKSALRISAIRLDDLLKEYEVVLPGLKDFVSVFRGQPAQLTLGKAVELLDESVSVREGAGTTTGDFALFNSGQEIVNALVSVGFIGVQESATGRYTFCHDGSAATLSLGEKERKATIHPCYWKALDVAGEAPPEEVMVQINDEYEVRTSQEVGDLRLRRLGQIVGEVSQIPYGVEGSAAFEKWVHRAAAILFDGKLQNIQLKPNPTAVNQRDIVATNMAPSGFWKRIYDDYKSRQVIFEVKNYKDISLDDVRQVLSYTSGEYGTFAIIVSRGERESPSEAEKNWLRMMYADHRRIVLLIPEGIVARCLSKLRSP